MTEYNTHLNFFKVYAHMHFSKLVKEADWGNEQLAEKYLKKYWLSEQEYLRVWKPIQDEIFLKGTSLPNLVYQPDFDMFALRGGCLFVEEDFKQLQKAMQDIGEEYFVIIQHSQAFTEGEPMFRMKYPVNITWKELTSGNYISAVLLEMSYNEYFVFSASGDWGKYAANDYDYPVDLIGFKIELTQIFQRHFKLPKEEQEEIWSRLPQEYKKLIKL
jgi:hypothetical protein